jgi:hypothetical protein
VADIRAKLMEQGLIKTQGATQSLLVLKTRIITEYGVDRITGDKMDHKGDDDQDSKTDWNQSSQTLQEKT